MLASLHILHGEHPDRRGFKQENYILIVGERGATYIGKPMPQILYADWASLADKLTSIGIEAREIQLAQKKR